MNRCPNVKTLNELKLDCEPGLIRAIWKAKHHAELCRIYPDAEELARSFHRSPPLRLLKRAAIDCAGGYFGVEYLGQCRRTGQHVYYCNAGDTYAPTLCFKGNNLFVSTMGDLIETGKVRELENQY